MSTSTTTNSSVLSFGPLPSNTTDFAFAGLEICGHYQNSTLTAGSDVPIAYVMPNNTLNITFAGSPPYNISGSYMPWQGSTVYCNSFVLLMYNSSHFIFDIANTTWLVNGMNVTAGYGDAIEFHAEATVPVTTGADNYTVYVSNYFQVSNNTASLGGVTKPTKSAAGPSASWKRGGVALALGLAILSVL